MARIVVLAGSKRRNGNTHLLANSFIDGAKASGNDVEMISTLDYNVNPCLGCNSCFKIEGNYCAQNDDMNILYDKLKNADVIVIASPVYFYGICAELKALIDRLHSPIRNSFKVKKLGIILVGGASLPNLFDSILMQYDMVLNYFKLESIGNVLVRGARGIGEIDENYLKSSYELGYSIKE